MKLKNVFRGLFVASLAMMSVVACEKPLEPTTLTVTPSSAISFQATANEDVIVTVTTNAAEWAVDAPEWVKVTKGGSKLIINAEDNTTEEERLGRIEISAEGAASVKINVSQAAGAGDKPVVTGAPAKLVASAEKVNFNAEGTASFTVKMVAEAAAEEEMSAEIVLDPLYLEEYEYIMDNDYNGLEESDVTFSATTLTIAKGQMESEAVTVTIKGENKEFNVGYLATVLAEPVAGVSFTKEAKRANVLAFKANFKDVKNLLYFEVNDTNPLNALEVVLEDGTPFFDAVILFAANINYNSVDDVVYLHNNPNVKALLDGTDDYLQPLRKKGIKVFLGLLGNHDQAGLCQLSDWGAQQFAREVAQTCRDCKLDGVNIDDEYSNYPDTGNKWFTYSSQAAGDRLCYELYKALKEECYWETSVNYYVLGSMRQCGPVKDLETEVVYQPEDYIDFYVADYGGATYPYAGLTKKQCCAMSLQLNYGYSATKEDAIRWKDEGFGWIMYFAYDPVGDGGIRSNRDASHNTFNQIAQGLYGQEVVYPTKIYRKLGEGKYQVEPEPLN